MKKRYLSRCALGLLIGLGVLFATVPPSTLHSSDTPKVAYVYMGIGDSDQVALLHLASAKLETIVDFGVDYSLTASFSPHARYMTYTRKDAAGWWLGVGTLPEWEPTELFIKLQPAKEDLFPQSVWLSDRYLVVSYTKPNLDTVERYLLDTQTMQLDYFPYKSVRVGFRYGELELQWRFAPELQHVGDFPDEYVIYDIVRDEMRYSDYRPLNYPINLLDIEYFGWGRDISAEFGFILSDNNQYVWFSPTGTRHELALETRVERALIWSPEQAQFLVKNFFENWLIYDAAQDSLAYTLPVLVEPVRWLDGGHLIYAYPEDGYPQKETIKVLALEENTETFILTIEALVFDIAVPH